ncbi:ABC transporter substrate-binding protein [Actinomadura terrae]|uniref:ABC transporter substrate-binding protein n=1 Tax=Actinomadura terrae TaxID=604353 RepID=UPI001FA7EBF2|nr:helical backbone metal receptor [Actinomadura terrae]
MNGSDTRNLLCRVILVGAMLVGIAGCGGSERLRIVSLSPTATEILYAVDAADQVVAVDNVSDYPPQVSGKVDKKLFAINPAFREIMRHKPTLVVMTELDEAAPNTGVVDQLRHANVDVLVQKAPRNLDQVYSSILDLGSRVGRERQAKSVVRTMRARVTAALASVSKSTAERTYFHEVDKSFYTATSNTFIGSIYALFGMQNIADGYDMANSGYPRLTSRQIIAGDPDFVFLADTKCCGQNVEAVRARPGWQKIAAVRGQGRIVELNADTASRWGPRIIDFVQRIARAIHEAK